MTFKKEKRQYIKKIITTKEENRKNPKNFFEISETIKQGFKPQTDMMVNDNKELVIDKKEIVLRIAERLKSPFENLLNILDSMLNERGNLMYTTEPIIVVSTREEIAKIIKLKYY